MKMNEQANSPEQALQAVQAWNDAWMARDLEKMKGIAADDYIQWHATVRKNLSKDEEFAMLVEALKVMQIEFKDIKLTPMSNGAVLQQCVADIIISGSEVKDVPFAMVYQTRGQQITRCDEYMDGMSLPKIDFTPKD
jgi:ketosteroid isomerase-like protein